MVKNPPANAGDIRDRGLIPGLGRSPGGGNANQLQYSCLKNPMERRAWWATVCGVTESDTTEGTWQTHLEAVWYSRESMCSKCLGSDFR